MDEKIIYWKELLLLMYQLDINKLAFDDERNLLDNNKKYEVLKSKLPNDAKIDVAVSKLIYLKYLERQNENKLDSFITKGGIEVALKLQEYNDNKLTQKKQEVIQKILIFLTFILSISPLLEVSELISKFFEYVFSEKLFIIKSIIFLILILTTGYIFHQLYYNKIKLI